VHWRRGTVRTDLVRWLVVGSVPAAFAGVMIVDHLDGDVEGLIKRALGIALLASAGTILLKARLAARDTPAPVVVRPVHTVLIGVAGGLLVGMTSVGSGSVMIVLILLVYPGLRPGELVGTDLVQAIPLVASATLAHALFGDVRLGVTTSLVIGGIPGVIAGARLSARPQPRFVRPALLVVLASTGLKLLV
jgi:uncharacterized membrane protein YfcA